MPHFLIRRIFNLLVSTHFITYISVKGGKHIKINKMAVVVMEYGCVQIFISMWLPLATLKSEEVKA